MTTFAEIAENTRTTAGQKAEACLLALAKLPPNDLAEDRLAAASIAYALLEHARVAREQIG